MSEALPVLVVGGGIAGLSAARAAAKVGPTLLVEGDDRLGGRILTESFRGRPYDVGPDSFITRREEAVSLAVELGLKDELIAPSTSSASVVARGRPRRLPNGLSLGIPTDFPALFGSRIVSLHGVLRAAADLVMPGPIVPADLADLARRGSFDPTIAEALGSRFGREVLELLLDPLLGGINAGSADELSFAAALPELARQLGDQRSAALALRKASTRRPRQSRPIFLGLLPGLGSLVDALQVDCRKRGADLRTGVRVTSLLRSADDRAFDVETTNASIRARAVILATPAYATAALVRLLSKDLSALCAAISYAGVVTVALAYPGGNHAGEAQGSGILVPRSLGLLTTAVTFTSAKWPRSANPGETLLRASLGRHHDERALELDDEALVPKVHGELERILGIRDEPVAWRVDRFPASFPQYTVGHLARVAKTVAVVEQIDGLELAGSAFDGIGIPACIASGERAVARLGLSPVP